MRPATEDDLDRFDARRYFRVSFYVPWEQFLRVVLERTGTGLDYSRLSVQQRAALSRWAVALGSLAPTTRSDWWRHALAMTEDAAAHAAREAARLTFELNQTGDPAGLARRLMPNKSDADPKAVLAVFGRRVYAAVDRVVEQHNADGPDERQRDEYNELAANNPETRLIWDDPEPEGYRTDDLEHW